VRILKSKDKKSLKAEKMRFLLPSVGYMGNETITQALGVKGKKSCPCA
jgi:hypothetical protein